MIKKEIRENGTRSHTLFNKEDSLTQQQFRDDCDVNVILKRIMKGEPGSPFVGKDSVYADVSELPSYQDALQTVIDANAEFMKMSSVLRQKFDNNPQKLIDYLSDDKNKEESYQLGLRERKVVPKNETVEAINNLGQEIKKTRAPQKKGEEA